MRKVLKSFATSILMALLITGIAFGPVGCAGLMKSPCTTLNPQKMLEAELVLKGIQKWYASLQALVPLIPGAGSVLAIAIPAALSGADLALNDLGQILATNCADDARVSLAQIALNTIEALFNNTEVQKLMATPQFKSNLARYTYKG
jgi:hypothetical protein